MPPPLLLIAFACSYCTIVLPSKKEFLWKFFAYRIITFLSTKGSRTLQCGYSCKYR